MNARQLIVLLIAIACLALGVVRIAKLFGNERENNGLPADQRRTWKCRVDGLETNLTPAEVDAQFAAGKITFDPANLAIQLYACPKCGRQSLEQVVIQVGPETSP